MGTKMLTKYRASLQILLLLIVFTPSCGRLDADSPTSSLFFVDNFGRLDYRFTLIDQETNKTITQNVDFSSTTWDVTLGSSRFSTMNGSENIHYNPVTKEIIFVLFPGMEGIGGWKPDDALPAPPFRFAIYKTSFDSQNQFTPLYVETSQEYSISHMVLSPQSNSLIMDVEVYDPVRHPEILIFDIGTQQFEPIANTETKLSGKELIQRSDLRLSPDGEKLYQLVLYGTPGQWINQTLYLKTINLSDRSVNYQEVISGDGIDYDILAISADGSNVAFFTSGLEKRQLWIKNIQSEIIEEIPITREIGSIQNYLSDDGKKILVGFRNSTIEGVRTDWEIYDLTSNEYQATPLDRPLAWDPSGRFIAGIKGNTYIIYDIETESETEIVETPGDYEYNQVDIACVQWR